MSSLYESQRGLRRRSVPMRLTLRGRVVFTTLLVLGVVAPLSARSAAAGSPAPAIEVQQHVVLSGETMWEIAAQIADPGEDVRDVVHDLVVLNDLPSADLLAGQVIVVPISG